MLKRIYHLKEEVEEMALVIYGDTLTNIDVDDLKKHHIEKGNRHRKGLAKKFSIMNEKNDLIKMIKKIKLK